jgi:hypothetical protein
MRLSTLILILSLSVTNGYSQSSTIGVLINSGDLYLSTDNINTSVINSKNPYAPWGIYTTAPLNITNNGGIPTVSSSGVYPNRLGINYGFFRNGLNVGIGGKMILNSIEPAKFYPDLMIKLHPIKMLTQNPRSIDVSLMLNISNTLDFGAGISIPFLLNRY